MSLTYNLSPLIKGKYRDPDVFGQWAQSGPLDDLATSLDVPRTDADIDQLKSLPDPWARPLLFGQALVTDSHIARRDAVSQWRGLLALLALQNFYRNSYVLGQVTIDLTDQVSGNQQFREVLRTLLPAETLSSEASWNKFGVLTIQQMGEDRFDVGEHSAIGMLVPNCLVAPAKGARQMRFRSVPWLADGLSDPLEQEAMPASQWAALYDFLGRIKVRLRAPDIVQGTAAEAIRKEVEAFMAGCKEKLAKAGVRSIPEADYASSNHPVPSSLYTVLLEAPLLPEDDGSRISDCEIALRTKGGLTKAQHGIEGAILLDPDIAARSLKRPIQDVKAWRNISLQSAHEPGDLEQIRNEATNLGYLVVSPDDLLTPKLVRLLNDGKIEAHGPRWENLLLPLSPLALFLLEKDKIISSLDLQDRGDRFEVSLTVNLKGSDANAAPIPHKIVRSYDKKHDVDQQAVPDDIILWPNLTFDRWPWNFMRFSYDSRYEMAPRFAVSAESLSAMLAVMARGSTPETLSLLQGLGLSTDLVFERMHPLFSGDMTEIKTASGELISHRLRFRETSDAIGEQHILGKGSEAIFLAGVLEDEGQPVPAGCMLLPSHQASLGQSKMEIAVDFGTTNTVVYFRTGGSGDPEPMVFRERVFRPLWSRMAEEDQFAYDCVELLPANDVVSPFPTVMHKRVFDLRGAQAMQDGLNSGYHGVSDNIFFMPDVKRKFSYAVERERNEQLEFDLKWGAAGSQRRMVRRFLRQIVLMSVVEAMDRKIVPQNINWNFSYPQAWDDTQVGVFKRAVYQAWEEILHPVLGRSEAAANHISFTTEGDAALRYFTMGPDKGRTGQRVLMFDIGGGSTEIAIYDFGTTLWRSSFKLAGGDFFTRFLSQNTRVFDQFHDEAVGGTFQQVLEEFGGRESTKHFVELYISQETFDGNFGDSYPMFSDEPEGVGLRNVALVMIAGYFYYTGLALSSLLKKGKFRAENLGEFTVAFAGRGSSFFKFLGEMRNEDSLLGRAVRVLSDVVQAANEDKADQSPEEWSSTKPKVNERFSEYPKHEVAYGMLCGDGSDKKRALYQSVPLGEAVTLMVDDQEVELSSISDISDLQPGARLIDIGEDEFDRFLALLRQRVGLNINIDSKDGEARSQINNTVKYTFAEKLSVLENFEDSEDDDETLEIEPPFISKLRCLVHMLAQNVAVRKKEIVVKSESAR